MLETKRGAPIGICPICGTLYAPDLTHCLKDAATLELTRYGDERVGQLFGGRYRLLRRLGSGGMGAVYEAQCRDTQRRVAVKVVHKTHNIQRKDIERLRMEARAVRMIDHPNVVSFLDYGQRDGQPYIVMERLRGKSLSQIIKRGGLLIRWERAAWIVMQAAHGVAAAHKKGLVHRDIKPGNVMVLDTPDSEGRDRVKVLDFGLVAGPTRLSDRLTMTGVVLGTPHYIAPEMCDHPPRVDPGADVYALGVLLFHLVVGHRPFDGDSFFAVIDSHLNKPIPKPRQTDNGEPIPRALMRTWMRALQKNPDHRYRNGQELALALESVFADAGGQGVTAPVPAGARLVGERHLVTVLSLALVDPNADRSGTFLPLDAIEPLIHKSQALIQKAGGQLHAGPSGGLRVVFGLPKAGEDDALTALHTAQQLRQLIAPRLGARAVEIGLHTRYVLTAPKRPGSLELRVLSDPFEVASAVGREGAKQEGLAMSGTTYRTLRRHLLDPVPASGQVSGESVHVVRQAVPPAAGVRRSRVPAFRPVGRDAELAKIAAWVGASVDQRRCSTHLVTGPAGIGKSRLATELGKQCAARHPGLQVLEARPQERPEAPFNVFERFLADAVGFTRTGRAEKVVQWVTEAVSMDGDPTARDDAWHILRLVGLADAQDTALGSAQANRQRAFLAFANLFRAVAAAGGALLLVDDADQADSGSLDLIDYLKRELADFPVCFVLLARESATLEDRFGVDLRLGPMSPAGSAELVDRLVGKSSTLDAETRKRIVARAEGNPLFIEELVRAAGEGMGELVRRLPESIRAVVTARIDALPPSVRAVLKAAAIVGRELWDGAVASQPAVQRAGADVPQALNVLARAGFLRQMSQSRFEDARQFRFQNQLTQEAAYQLASVDTLTKGHRAVARWLGAQAGAGAGAMPHAMMAMHLERARANEEASAAWRAAGDAARDRYANRDAARMYGKALALQQKWSAEDIARCELELGVVRHLAGQQKEAQELLKRAVRFKGLDATARCRAMRHLARTEGWQGHSERQRRILQRAVNASSEASLSERLMVASDLAYSMVRGGKTQMAEQLLEQAIHTAYSADSLFDLLLPLAQLHQSRALLNRNRGQLKNAVADAKASIDLFEQVGHLAGKATTLTSLSVALRDLGRYDEAADAARQAADSFREWGYGVHELTALVNLAWCHYEAGAPEAARHLFRALRVDFAKWITAIEQALIDAGDALASRALGQHDDAKRLAQRAVDGGASSPLAEVKGWTLYAAGIVAMDKSMLEDSAACWRMLDRPAWLARTLDALLSLEPEGTPRRAMLTDEVDVLRVQLRG